MPAGVSVVSQAGRDHAQGRHSALASGMTTTRTPHDTQKPPGVTRAASAPCILPPPTGRVARLCITAGDDPAHRSSTN